MGSDLSRSTTVEVTRKYAGQYARASRKDKGRVRDEFCALTGPSQEQARHLLVKSATRTPNATRIDRRKAEPRNYSNDSREVLEHLWALSGGWCGPHLAAGMSPLLDALVNWSRWLDC
ncbi:transposase [Rhodococcus sp. DMU1]|uniref:transposase n=1 Tax=Rhodococcus sp. DMU1 TaxID=2722825 RepID=UPI00143E8A69|nr:transposase [Rhodococcus sp. DMU1]QIX53862.1 transposase [Rhodococcus sp. DMU1]